MKPLGQSNLSKFSLPFYFSDRKGSEAGTLMTNGHLLRFVLRGVPFSGPSFNLLSFSEINKEKVIGLFDIDEFDAVQGIFSIEYPLTIVEAGLETIAPIILQFDYTTDKENISYSFNYHGVNYKSERVFSFVENALIDLRQQLSNHCKINCCLSCKYSSYHPVGNNDFGDLACFKYAKNALSYVKDKCSLLDVWENIYQENQLSQVQETFICSEFTHCSKEDWLYKCY
ncbi:hypothetical protein I4902_05525 [Proteus alimentorum]|uniref:Uncharacterized protein n=1 Tax=Proteus alimentorum TaxID=1973495 RepID=A0ABS0IRV7_9GAMM|nr:DUF6304 family protein [Proteus alimentorum]MBG2874894.1 hypothetical protein [Proteus alimentorum]MBG2878725.1 hypothetical protein [Proteus alimentorum]